MDRRASLMPGVRRVSISDTGHNLHHDAPGQVADLIERFIRNPDDRAFGGLSVRGAPQAKSRVCEDYP
jgi:hypothetical protein